MDTLRRFVALGALIPLLALTACTSGGTVAAGGLLSREDRSGADSDGFPAPSQEMVWNAAMAVVRDAGYVPDPNLSSPESGRVETRWRMKLTPFSGMGKRERATVRIHKIKKKTNYFKVETNVLAQANDNIKDPSNPVAAEWTQGTRDADLEQMLNRRIEMMFLKGDVSSEFRRKHDMGNTDKGRYVEEKPAPKPSGMPDFGIFK